MEGSGGFRKSFVPKFAIGNRPKGGGEAIKKKEKKEVNKTQQPQQQQRKKRSSSIKNNDGVLMKKRKIEKPQKDSDDNDENTCELKEDNTISEETIVATDGLRRIVFIGNLPFTATSEDIRKHFGKDGIKQVRLLTKKGTTESRGCAFVELINAAAVHHILRYHHTMFQKRQINVELTAGGGGSKSAARKAKIEAKNRHFRSERKVIHEREASSSKKNTTADQKN